MKIYRIAPCPIYDIECTQTWLEDMANKGLILKNLGYCFSSFEHHEPSLVRYRIEPLPKKSKNLNQAVALVEEFGWSMVCKHKNFAVYMTENMNAPELHTDANIHASVFNYMIQSLITNILISAFIFYNIYFRTYGMTGYVSGLINIGPIFFLTSILSICYVIIMTVMPIYHLIKYKREIKTNKKQTYQKKPTFFSRLYNIIFILTIASLVCLFMKMMTLDDVDKNRLPLSTYQEALPFVTVNELYPEKVIHPKDSFNANTIKIMHQGLYNTYINYHEIVNIEVEENKEPLLFGLYVEYYDLKIEQLANAFVKDLFERSFEENDSEYLTDIELPSNIPFAFKHSKDFNFFVVQDHIVMKVGFSQDERNDLDNLLTYQDIINIFSSNVKEGE